MYYTQSLEMFNFQGLLKYRPEKKVLHTEINIFERGDELLKI